MVTMMICTILIMSMYIVHSLSDKETIKSYPATEKIDLTSKCLKFTNTYYQAENWYRLQKHIDEFSRDGHWVRHEEPVNVTRCFQDLTKSCVNATRSRGLQYTWKVKNAKSLYHIKPFSLQHICKIMAGETIMFVGDSVTSEFVTAMLNYVYASDPSQCNPDMTLFTTGMYEIKCSNFKLRNFRIQSIRNDFLSMVSKRVIVKKDDYVVRDNHEEHAWIPLLTINNPAVVVLNRGAHFTNTSIFLREVQEAVSFIVKNHPNTTIIWRNTPRGIENFRRTFYIKPHPTPLDPKRPSNYTYAYEQFHEQNLAVRAMLEEKFPLRVYYWDVSHPMSFREDGHRDPLHYCIPGPMDNWPHFLVNILSMFRKAVPHYTELNKCLVTGPKST